MRYYRSENRHSQPPGGENLDALAEDARLIVMSGLIRYAMSGEDDVKRLSGRAAFRLRLGRYRVIFDEDSVTILAIYIGKRATTTYLRGRKEITALSVIASEAKQTRLRADERSAFPARLRQPLSLGCFAIARSKNGRSSNALWLAMTANDSTISLRPLRN